MMAKTLPGAECRPHDPHHAGTIHLEIALERPQQQLRFLALGNVRVAVVEPQLSVDVRNRVIGEIEQPALCLKLCKEWRSGDWGVEHELMEFCRMAHGMLNRFVDIVEC